MQTIKIDRKTLDALSLLDEARNEKNAAIKAEKTIKTRLNLPDGEAAFIFDRKVVAMQTESFRSGIDLEKLAKDYPKAFAACQTENKVLTLKITI